MSTHAVDDTILFRYAAKILTSEPEPRFLGSGFLAAPGFAVTCAHVVASVPDGRPLRIDAGPAGRPTVPSDVYGVVRARSAHRPGPDQLWDWPDLAIVELRGPGDTRYTAHPCPRLDLDAPTPVDGRYRAIVAARPNPSAPQSTPRLRGVNFQWESQDDRGFWWFTHGETVRGMSGSMLVDPRHGSIVAVLNNRRGAPGGVATPLTVLRKATGHFGAAAGEVIDAYSDVTGLSRWDDAFRRTDDGWRDHWLPDISVGRFVGRHDELHQLKQHLDEADGLATVQSIGGFGGVGKTALAVAFANQYRHLFRDGRVFHDFRSYRSGRADTPFDALGTILEAVGAATADEIGRLDLRHRIDRWMSTVSQRRLLMVWDNVHSADQLDGILARGDGCATIITSRDHIRIDGSAAPFRLDVLTETDAIAMFRRIAGNHHPPDLVAELVRRDLFVPVLIATHAEEVAAEETTLAEIIADLPEPDNARHLSDTEHQEALFARLRGSYRRLPPDVQKAFRTLGAHPGYSATAGSLAAGMGCGTDEAISRMNSLLRAGLAERDLTGGGDVRPLRAYKAHDLIRAFGERLADAEGETETVRTAIAAHYQAGLTGETFHNPQGWLGVEADSIRDLALAGTAEHYGRLARYAGYRALVYNRYDLAEAGFAHARAIADRHGNQKQVGNAVWGLGETARLLGELDTAHRHYLDALRLSTQVSDPGGIGNAERGLAEVAQLRGDAVSAERHYTTAMRIYQSIPDERRVAYTQRGLARVAELQGRLDVAAQRFQEALRTSTDAGDQIAIAYAHRGLAEVLLKAGNPAEAAERYRAVMTACDAITDPVGVATGEHGLGRVALATGDPDAARTHFDTAASVYKAHNAHTWLDRLNADRAGVDDTGT